MRRTRNRRPRRPTVVPATVAPAALAALAALSLGVSACGELEPFEPGSPEAPFRFFGAAADGPGVFLTEVAVTDTTVEIQLRAREVERLTAVAFELSLGEAVAGIDTAAEGDFFQPGNPVVFELAGSPQDPLRWLGVVSMADYSSDVSGGGLLASLVVRRLTDEPFDVRLAFDTATTRLYGPAGQPMTGQAVGGRLVYDPATGTTAP